MLGSPRAGEYETLCVGDLAPWFRARCLGETHPFSFDMAAGRLVLLCFYGRASDASARAALGRVEAEAALFEGGRIAFFGVSLDPADESDQALHPHPGRRHFADADGTIGRSYGVLPRDGEAGRDTLRPRWFVLDPRLRVIAVFPLDRAGTEATFDYLGRLPAEFGRQLAIQAPVLSIPHVLEPEFCQRLIAVHRRSGAPPSGVLTEGAVLSDPGFKSRRDCRIADKALAAQLQTRIFRRVVPELKHAFQFEATRMERLILVCYDAAEGGRFGPHRDNTVAETRHRRFAISLNLNDDFTGGGLIFPEYGRDPYSPPAGGALVFSCSLLHEVAPIARGRRYACVPFVYDDAAAAARQRLA